MDYVAKYNRESVPSVPSPKEVHSISSYNEREENHGNNVSIRKDGNGGKTPPVTASVENSLPDNS